MYKIIRYHLDLGLYETLDTGIIAAISSYLFIFKWFGDMRFSGLVVQCQ